MCGIAGILGGGAVDPAALERMAAAMANRGPDGSRTWADGDAGLAFRRLSIVDLHERSLQPQHLGPLHLVFNGEIYNFRELRTTLERRGVRFATEGDAEVLLHAWATWGEQTLDRLNGMFALAVYDDERRELVLASCPLGKKPLLWNVTGGRLVFASSFRSLRAAAPHLATPNPEALAPFLALGLMPPSEESFFAGVHRVPAGHLLRFRDGRTELRRYWKPTRVDVPARYDDAVAVLRGHLEDAVHMRLGADVAIGSSLSGGVDSSAVLALTQQATTRPVGDAFTAAFSGFERDEWTFATSVAASTGVARHHAVRPSADDAIGDLLSVAEAQEEPFGSLSIYAQFRVYRAARDAGVRVMFDGQGGDELFGGYDGTMGFLIRGFGPRRAIRTAAARPDLRMRIALAYGATALPRATAYRYRRSISSPYLRPETLESGVRFEPAIPDRRTAGGALRRELLRQLFHTSLPTLLRYADRNSMDNACEVRLPLLDRKVVEFALSCPPSYLYREGRTKAILRDAVRDLVPTYVLDRRDKVGFEPPQTRWLTTEDGLRAARELLLDGEARGRGLYDTARIEGALRDPARLDSHGIWRAMSTELWLRGIAAA